MHQYEVRATVSSNGWLDFSIWDATLDAALAQARWWVSVNCPGADIWAITELAEDDDAT